MLHQLDALVRALAPGSGVPADAIQPPDSARARLEYIDERLQEICTTTSLMVSRPATSGWEGVFAAVRVLTRALRAQQPTGAGSSSTDLSGSFGRYSAHHRSAATADSHQGASSSSSALHVSPLDHSHAAELQRACVSVDQEGRLPPAQHALLAAAQHVSGACVIAPTDEPAVLDLGSRLQSMPRELHVIEAADGRGFASTSSAHMSQLHHSLLCIPTFFDKAAELLRAHIGKEPALTLLPSRKDELVGCIRDLFRGKPSKLSELRLRGTGASSLFDPLRAGDDGRMRNILLWLDYAVRLFNPPPSGTRSFFAVAAERVTSMVDIDGNSHALVASFMDNRLRAFEDSSRRFYAGSLLLRPAYESSWLDGTEACNMLSELQRRSAAPVPNSSADPAGFARAVQAIVSSMQPGVVAGTALPPPVFPPGAAPIPPAFPPVPPGTLPGFVPFAPAPAPTRPNKRQRKVAAAPAAVVPVLPMAPQAPVLPAAPAAAPVIPAINQIGLVGPAPHVGAAGRDLMKAFSDANKAADGRGKCFNFFRRGVCNRGDACAFAHVA